jgi:WD40 repeat protein
MNVTSPKLLPARSAEAEAVGFAVFLAYSTEDRREAVRLQRDLEQFRIPRSLVGMPGRFGRVPRRLGRVFLDRTDLSAAQDITEEITAALARSQNLVVLCSNSAADSKRWVGREILAYRRTQPGGRIFAVILRDEPPTCFPTELYRSADPGETDTGHSSLVPLAADMRPQGDGRRDALTKLVAGLVGIEFDVLRRQRARAERRRRIILSSFGLVYAMTISAALIGVGYAALELLSSRNAAIADRAKSANEAGRTDQSLLLAAVALPVRPSLLERPLPSAEAQAVRAILGHQVESMFPSGGADLSEWDPASQRLYLSTFGGELTAIDVVNGGPVADWPVRIRGVTALALSVDGDLLAVAVENGGLQVINARTGAVLSTSDAVTPASSGRSLAFTRNGERVAIGRQDGTAQVWSIEKRRWISDAPRRGNWPVLGIAFSSDETRVLSASSPTLLEWEANSGRLVRHRGRPGSVTHIQPLDGLQAWAVSQVGSSSVSILPEAVGAEDRVVPTPHPPSRTRLSPDGRLLVVPSWEGQSASLIDLSTGQIRATLTHREWVNDAILLSDGGRVLTLARDRFARVWRDTLTVSGTRQAVFTRPGPSVIARNAEGRIFIGGGGPTIAELDAHRDNVRTFAELPCVNPGDASSRCWIVGLHVTGSSGDLVYAAADGRVGRIDQSNGRAIWEADIGVPIVRSALHPDGLHLVVLLGQGGVARLSLEDGRSIDAAEGAVTQSNEIQFGGFAFSRSGDSVAELDRDGLTLRRTSDRSVVWRAPVYDRIAVSATWVPPGNIIAAGTAGNTVQLFPASGGPATMILRGHSSLVAALHSSPSGRYLASVSFKELIVWDLIAGEIVKTVSAGPIQGGFSDVSFSADGRSILLADSAGGFWSVPFNVPFGSLFDAVCAALPDSGRRFNDAQMREFAFLRAVERAPCERPALLSFQHIRVLANDFWEGVWPRETSYMGR